MKVNDGAGGGLFRFSNLQTVSLFLVLLASMILFAGNAFSAQVTLAWDANGDASTRGYKVHYGTQSGAYTSSIDVGSATSCTINNLNAGTIYYLAATAYDSDGTESDYSEELVVNTPTDSTPLDSDADGISDEDETNVYRTDPNNADSDGDGMRDGAELTFWGSNWNRDDDGDGIVNLLDPSPYPKTVTKRVNMQPILNLLLEG